MKTPLFLISTVVALSASTGFSQETKKLYEGTPLNALLITGGCCHNYGFQSEALTQGVSDRADVAWTVVNDGGTGTEAEIALYQDPDWAKPYDVIVHNECFANTDNADYIEKILKGHQAGKPAVVIHCAMHTYRKWEQDGWREFLGVTSKRHDHQSQYPVTVAAKDHPVMKDFPANWVTPKDELYVIEKLWPNATALAESRSEKEDKTYPVIWANDYQGTRVFGTTYGHSDDTFRDPVFINLLTRGLLWSAGKLK